jgi:hypothetical protein
MSSWSAKAKDVPLHATKTLVWRGDIAPTHSGPGHWMGVSGQRHAPSALYPQAKDPRYPLYWRLGGPQTRSGHRGYRKKSFRLCRGSNLDQLVVQPVARHYTDWATQLTSWSAEDKKISGHVTNFNLLEFLPRAAILSPLLIIPPVWGHTNFTTSFHREVLIFENADLARQSMVLGWGGQNSGWKHGL